MFDLCIYGGSGGGGILRQMSKYSFPEWVLSFLCRFPAQSSGATAFAHWTVL